MTWILFALATARADGGSDFQMYCSPCHGPTGAGDGPAGAALNPRPASFADPAFWTTRDDASLKTTIQQGGAAVGKSPAMPPWGATLSETQVDAIVAYLKTLKR